MSKTWFCESHHPDGNCLYQVNAVTTPLCKTACETANNLIADADVFDACNKVTSWFLAILFLQYNTLQNQYFQICDCQSDCVTTHSADATKLHECNKVRHFFSSCSITYIQDNPDSLPFSQCFIRPTFPGMRKNQWSPGGRCRQLHCPPLPGHRPFDEVKVNETA